MSTKRHLNIHGRYVPCEATKRACRYQGTHITEQKYNQLVEQNDPTTIPVNTKISYLKEAEENYKNAIKQQHLYNSLRKDFANEVAKSKKKLAKTQKYDKTEYTQDNITKINEDVENYIKNSYIEAGVHPVKANYITQDVIKNGYKPVTKKRADKYDSELPEKTRKAVQKMESENKIQELIDKRNHIKDYLRTEQQQESKLLRQHIENLNKNNIDIYGSTLKDNVEKAKQQLAQRQTWKEHKIPNNSTATKVTQLTPENISQTKGKINNLWVENSDGTIKKIVKYVPAKHAYESGHLLTEDGQQVKHLTHHHSYKTEEKGNNTIIVAPKTGKDFKQENFYLSSRIDTGD